MTDGIASTKAVKMLSFQFLVLKNKQTNKQTNKQKQKKQQQHNLQVMDMMSHFMISHVVFLTMLFVVFYVLQRKEKQEQIFQCFKIKV